METLAATLVFMTGNASSVFFFLHLVHTCMLSGAGYHTELVHFSASVAPLAVTYFAVQYHHNGQQSSCHKQDILDFHLESYILGKLAKLGSLTLL